MSTPLPTSPISFLTTLDGKTRFGTLTGAFPSSHEVNLRTTLHEYGGVPCTLWQINGAPNVVGTSFRDGMYSLDVEDGKEADGSSKNRRWTRRVGGVFGDYSPPNTPPMCVREEANPVNPNKNTNTVVSVGFKADEWTVTTLASGADFYSYPCSSAGGGGVSAWVQWDHPNMPWDVTAVFVDGEAVEGGGSNGQVRVREDGEVWWVGDGGADR